MPKKATPNVPNTELPAIEEELDHVLRVVRPRTWVALLTLGVLMAVAVAWGFAGRVTTKISGQGILIKSGVLFPIVAVHSGQVLTIEVEPGQAVNKGDVVARLDQPLLRSQLREAQSLLDKLNRDREQLEQHEANYDTLVKMHIEKQRQKLRESIRIGFEFVRDQKELVASIQELVQKGGASRLDLEKQKNELRRAQIQILQDEQELSGLDVFEHQVHYEVDQRLSDLIRLTVPVKERVLSLQEQLTTHSVAKTLHAGTIVEVHKNRGAVLREGDSIALLELDENESESEVRDTVVVAYVPSFQGLELRPGMQAHVIPETVREEEYGLMLGEVTAISPFPVSSKGMLRVLGNEEWVNTLIRDGAPTMVTIRLHKDADTVSGYRWSSGKGPPTTVNSGAQCVVRIIARHSAPVDLVVPQLKRRLLGIGEGDHR